MADARMSPIVGWIVTYESDPPERDLVLAAEAQAEWAVDEDHSHWLRFSDRDAESFARLSRESFRVDEFGRLFSGDERVPFGVLPKLQWRPVQEVIDAKLPVAGYPEQVAHKSVGNGAVGDCGTRIEKFPLRLVPAHQSTQRSPLPVAAISVTLQGLSTWVEGAAARRLARLRWVVRDSTALVMGESLPPVAGDYFVRVDRLLIPAGMWWTPELPAVSVVRLMDGRPTRAETLHVWQRDQSVQHVKEDSFATLSRAALRASLAGGR
ncbi:MAG: hypothetical protein AAFU85_27305 [Planctomycetota bacterium]